MAKKRGAGPTPVDSIKHTDTRKNILAGADSGVSHGLLALSRQGLLTIGAPASPNLYPAFRRTRRRHPAAELLDEERGSR